MRLSATIKGRPAPKVVWLKSEKPIEDDGGRLAIKKSATRVSVEIEKCNRADSGRYSLVLEDALGKKTSSVIVSVLDVPGEPREIAISEVRAHSLYLRWKAPKDNGGAVISNYRVERIAAGETKWRAVSLSTKKTSMTMQYLVESQRYRYRVCAENQFGLGPYRESEEVKCIDPIHPPAIPKNLEIVDVDETAVTITWIKPARDGGSAITGYKIEFQEDSEDGINTKWETWKTVTK